MHKQVFFKTLLFSLLTFACSKMLTAQFTQQGSKFIGTGATHTGEQGEAVAISGDGTTAIVGIPSDASEGGAFIYTLSGGVWVQQGGKLLGTGATQSFRQGLSVSISSDGNTAIIGSNGGGFDGSAFVFTRSGGLWSQQGILSASGYSAYSVSISADGNTAIVGSPDDNSGVGAARIFTRSGGIWSQQGAKLVGTGAVGNAGQGFSVSISADGNTAIVGGNNDSPLNGGEFSGAVWIYTRTGGVWTQQGTKLVGTGAVGPYGAQQGYSVSISSDGNTAIVGGNRDNFLRGAAWIFTRSGSVWAQQGNKLVGTGAVGGAGQGNSVDISSDGNTAIVGGYVDNSGAGASWVYTRTGGVWAQQGAKLVGTGIVGTANQGYSVSISSDGNTAIAGGPGDNAKVGSSWIFTRSGTVWAQQGQKLLSVEAFGLARQGIAVAVSSDGNTAIVGGYDDNLGVGAVWIYTRSGSLWAQQGTKLVGAGAVGYSGQGKSVAISADGNTAIVGSPDDNGQAGAVWVFTRFGGVWTQQGSKLVGTGITGNVPAQQGSSVAISADGNTAVIGGLNDNGQAGAVWVFTRSGGVWTQQGSKLVGTGAVGNAGQGSSVGISADGNTLITGGPSNNFGKGAIWIYTRGGNVWTQQGTNIEISGFGTENLGTSVSLSSDGNTAIAGGANSGGAWVFIRSAGVWALQSGKLVGTGAVGTGLQGVSVSISSDGNKAVVGGNSDNSYTGAAWVYTRSGNVWAQEGAKLVGTGYAGASSQGTSVAISSDGNTAIVGGFNDNNTPNSRAAGAAWVYTAGANITSITPTTAISGTTVTINGGNFSGATAVSFGGTAATSFTVVNSTTITAVVAAGSSGAVSVRTLSGTAALAGFTFFGSPTITSITPTSAGSGITVTITGNNLAGATAVSFGGTAATSFTVVNATTISATVGTGSTGSVNITTPGGTATLSGFTFLAVPTISSFTPTSGGTSTTITISGSNFSGASAVIFGGLAATTFTVVNAATITAVVAAGSSGSVSVTTAGGTATLAGFTFIPSPIITSFTPTTVVSGTTVTITGTNFTGATAVSFGGTAAGSFTVVNSTTITAVVATGISGSVSVTTAGGTAILAGFTFISITSFTPTSARSGTTVTITGANLTGATSVSFGGTAATSFTVVNATTITAVVAAGTSGNVIVTTPNGTASSPGFTFYAAPTISSFTPTSSAIGATVTITGTNLTGITAVTFGGTAASSFTVVNTSSINAVVGIGASGSVSVTTPGGTATRAGFTFYAAPSITGFTPSSGSVGTLVTITGANLNVSTGFSIGGVPAVVVSNTGSTLVGMVMPGAATRSVSITTNGGTATSGSNFIVTPTPYPTTQQGPKLVGSGITGETRYGEATYLAADGNTAIVGGSHDNSNRGSVWIYIRSGQNWQEQVKLVGTGTNNNGNPGIAVSLSADGNTAIVGRLQDNNNLGGATIYIRSGGVWTQQATLLGTGSIGTLVGQGSSVALSSDGNTAVIGGPQDDLLVNQAQQVGAAWVFTRSGTTWTQQSKLIGTGGIATRAQQGTSVSISGDGNTIIVGGPQDNNWQGAAWLYIRSGGTWVQQTKLVGTGAIANAAQGQSVSLSADGNTALVGGNSSTWVFSRSVSTWTQQTQLVGTGAIGDAFQGRSVSLSADGNTAMVGGPGDNSFQGAAWLFTRSGNTWTQKNKLIGTGTIGQARQGYSVSLAYDGSTAISGGIIDNNYKGAAWIFVAAPTIISISPTSASTGTTVTISGTNFTGTTAVSFGGTAATTFTVVNATTITAVVGNGASGNIGITTPIGTASLSGFTYLASPKITSFSPTTAATGATVTITGTNLTGTTAVSFGGTAATPFTVVNATTITAVVGAGASGIVSVTTASGTASSAGFTFTTPPSVTTTAPATNTVTPSSAVMGGDLTVDGNSPIIHKGVVYNTTGNPTTADNVVNVPGFRPVAGGIITAGTGQFSVTLGGLNSATTYYAKAYANNNIGVAYGQEVSFTTSPPSTTNIWTGAVSDLWNVAGNWSLNAVPTSSSDIAINFGTPRLSIDFSIANSLIISGPGSLTVLPGKTLSIATGGNANFNAKSVILQSDATGTASLGQVNGTLAGATNITVERFIPAHDSRAWRLLSVPIKGAQTIRQAWQDLADNQAGEFINDINYGTLITSPFGNPTDNGFDKASVSNSLLTYNGSAWIGATTTNTAIETKGGYFLYVRGDRSKGTTTGLNDVNSTTLRTTGQLYQGNVSNVVPANSFAVIGNIYPSRVDYTQLNKSNIDDVFYIWDAKKISGNSLGFYQTFSGADGYKANVTEGSFVVGNSYPNIESGQAFFVHNSSLTTTGNVDFTENAKSTGSSNNGFRPATPAANPVSFTSNLYSTGANSYMADANKIIFDQQYTNVVDGKDALKMTNPGENFAIKQQNKNLAIEARQPITSKDTIFYNIWNLQKRTYQLELKSDNLTNPGLTAILQDAHTGVNTVLNVAIDNKINFTVDATPASAAANRFRVVFAQASLAPLPVSFISVSANRSAAGNAISWKVAAESNIAKYEVDRSANGRNFTKTGTVTASAQTTYSFTDVQAMGGTTFYRIKGIGLAGEVKYSNIVKLTAGNIKPGYSIAPNPAEGNMVNLQFKNQVAGDYQVSISTIIGQRLHSSVVAHAGGNSTQVLNIADKLPTGTYQLEIIAPDNNRQTQSFVMKSND